MQRGSLLFLSGQTASPPVPDSFREELDAAFSGIDDALTQAGARWQDIARITLFIVDLPSRSLDEIREVRDRWIDADHLPASSFIGVSALALAELRVEIEAIAVLPESC